ncbi:3-oxoacyl-(acyl-carrier-protein) synthase 2 [Planctopirus limnophila DSM 3776]|uniref:3-oxoacyl-[acyl-carrier-protein] synthase 2 n=1 Tax=Planctopirus limnophila (strain ATCC 43296 / DSM 3776 / IFAM 1008 / Mu 290) TaxID=521674 RepID=D5SQ14_PLAL2|nr:beta-ketoacyl-ACP synthase II [Planctopirus limnophila]ADG68389.1 3-oxoacyl-(acyl-carrier-protein) synthase 2 [Planctopirus limnophila DSM 3776]
MARRVVVTGMSVVTALGCDLSEFWDNICSGKSGVSRLERFDPSEFKVNFGGEIKDFHPEEHFDPKEMKRLDRFCQFAMAAADKAIKQSGIDFKSYTDPYRCGVIVGSGIGGLNEIEEQHARLFDRGPSRVSPFMIPKLMVNAASGNLSVYYGLKGPSSAVATACASASNAIGDAFRVIQSDMADVMIAGGSEAAITPMGLSGFARMGALSTRLDSPECASRPFDRDRDGFVLSEGAGVVLLEEYEHAKARGAEILAEVLGYGMSSDGNHMTAPDPEGAGAARAMANSLRDAKLNPSQIQYINAHGTSTPLGDKAESNAIMTVFGEESKTVCVSSTKSQLGHLLGASGGVEFVVGVMTCLQGIIPPTINLDNQDPDCKLDYVPNVAREREVKCMLSNSFGFGGHNACLVVGRI